MLESMMDIIKDIDWDTFRLKANHFYYNSEVSLFSSPISSSKSPLETSMQMSMMLPQPQHRTIERLQIIYGEDNSKVDNQAFRSVARYELWIGYKIYDYGPFARFQSWDSTEDLERLLRNVQVAKSLGFKVAGSYIDYTFEGNKVGHHIPQGMSFQFKILFDGEFKPEKDFKLVVVFEGIKARGRDM